MQLRARLNTLRQFAAELQHPGERRGDDQALWRLGRTALTAVIVTTNLVGAVSVVVIAVFVVPIPAIPNRVHVRELNALLAGGYVVLALLAGTAMGTYTMRSLRAWLLSGREPSAAEIRTVVQGPLRLSLQSAGLWSVAALLFGAFNASYSLRLGGRVFVIVLIAGAVTAALAYLLTELCLRPVAARAMRLGPPERPAVPGVATRSVLGWLLGTGLPLIGIVAIGVMALRHDRTLTRPLHQLGISMVVLGGTGLAVGLLAVILVARMTADPIDSVRRALAEVERGGLEVRVPVYDGTQIGRLQLGFNQMVSGLQERERIREAFGAYVDPDVAERVLAEGTSLRGEQVEVTCMFIDIRNFTEFSERTEPEQVVNAINELFTQFVGIIHQHGGRVDKFIGDGLLAVFGAPRRQAAHADCALAAALQIAAEASSSVGLTFGVGLNSGPVVAGNVGGAGRLEFSVIGDAVNVASRVESATRSTGDTVLLSDATRRLLGEDQPPLVQRPGIELKGRREPIALYAPAS
jgi:adenylate cyclase